MNLADTYKRQQAMASEYAKGHAVTSIAKKYDVAASTVRAAVHVVGVPVRPSGRPPKPVKPTPPAPVDKAPTCCGRPKMEIVDALTGVRVKWLCIRCWKEQA